MKKTNFKYLLWAAFTASTINLAPLNAIYAEGEESNPSARFIYKNSTGYATTVEVQYKIYNKALNVYYERTLTSDEITGDVDSAAVQAKAESFVKQIESEIGVYETHADTVDDIVNTSNTIVNNIDEVINIIGKTSDGEEETIESNPSTIETDYANYPGTIYVTTTQTKHQKYTITHTATANYNLIDSLDVTVVPPTVGATISDDTTNCVEVCEGQTNAPTVIPEGEDANAVDVESSYWITEESSFNQKYEGTIEKDTDYYAIVGFSAQHGYIFSDHPKITANDQAPFENLGLIDNLYATIIVKVLSSIVPVQYTILSGANQTYQKENVIIRASGDFDKFLYAMMDGAKLGSDFYSATSGSTVLELYSTYLDTLEAGTHTLTFVYEDGSVETSIIIPEAETETGENSNTEPTGTDDETSSDDETPTDTETTDSTEEAPKAVTVATKTNTINNPQTADDVQADFAIFLLSVVGFIGAAITISKKH